MKPGVRWCALVVYIVLFRAAGTLDAANRPKFQPSGAGLGIDRYVVTLAENIAEDDLGALKRELALTYGARLEASTASDGRRFVVIMLPARARLLSADDRVSEVSEAPLTTPVPRPSGYGDNGHSGTYSYDGAGNITAIGPDASFYDTAQRLVRSVTRGVQEDYSYDAFGNL